MLVEQLSQTLVGVAGVDVPVATFHSALPDSQLGFGGYKMVVMPTGNALLHPQLEQHASYIEVIHRLKYWIDFSPLGLGPDWA